MCGAISGGERRSPIPWTQFWVRPTGVRPYWKGILSVLPVAPPRAQSLVTCLCSKIYFLVGASNYEYGLEPHTKRETEGEKTLEESRSSRLMHFEKSIRKCHKRWVELQLCPPRRSQLTLSSGWHWDKAEGTGKNCSQQHGLIFGDLYEWSLLTHFH